LISKLRERTQGESGFTLVELLVVMLIIGLLAAIAIPAFFNQRNKATDTQAKVLARTAETAMETFATDNGGSYAAATVAGAGGLVSIEPTLNDAGANLTIPAKSANTYTVQVKSNAPSGNLFQITRTGTGTTTLDCGTTAGVPPTGLGVDGCPASGKWG
jgi:type IV pilus assembly protein PilA